ncbi:MAG: ABC transporter substrate-binding protein [Candidatus Promineifilaceae bacterium]
MDENPAVSHRDNRDAGWQRLRQAAGLSARKLRRRTSTPVTTTGGNDFDASVAHHLQPPRRVRAWRHRRRARASPRAGTSPTTASTYTFQLRPGVKFHTTDYFTPTRDLNADDVIFSFERQWKDDNPWNKPTSTASAWDYFQGMDMPKFLKRRSRRSTT